MKFEDVFTHQYSLAHPQLAPVGTCRRYNHQDADQVGVLVHPNRGLQDNKDCLCNHRRRCCRCLLRIQTDTDRERP